MYESILKQYIHVNKSHLNVLTQQLSYLMNDKLNSNVGTTCRCMSYNVSLYSLLLYNDLYLLQCLWLVLQLLQTTANMTTISWTRYAAMPDQPRAMVYWTSAIETPFAKQTVQPLCPCGVLICSASGMETISSICVQVIASLQVCCSVVLGSCQ